MSLEEWKINVAEEIGKFRDILSHMMVASEFRKIAVNNLLHSVE